MLSYQFNAAIMSAMKSGQFRVDDVRYSQKNRILQLLIRNQSQHVYLYCTLKIPENYIAQQSFEINGAKALDLRASWFKRIYGNPTFGLINITLEDDKGQQIKIQGDK